VKPEDRAKTVDAEDDRWMVELGLGKNMVKSLRFWIDVFGIATEHDGVPVPSRLGELLFDVRGLDPFLESPQTLWLMHWKVTTLLQGPLLAWDLIINRSTRPEFSRSQFVRSAREHIGKSRRGSDLTLAQHFDIFVHTYAGTSSRRGDVREDSLDSPLAELELLAEVGDRVVPETRRREPVYSLRRASRDDVSQQLFAFFVADYWMARRPFEETVGFDALYDASGGPGRVLRMLEPELRERLDNLGRDFPDFFSYRETQGVQQLMRRKKFSESDRIELLRAALGERR